MFFQPQFASHQHLQHQHQLPLHFMTFDKTQSMHQQHRIQRLQSVTHTHTHSHSHSHLECSLIETLTSSDHHRNLEDVGASLYSNT